MARAEAFAVRADALATLRAATRSLHDAVEREAGFDVARGTVGDYVAHLRTLAAWLCEMPDAAVFGGRNADRVARLRRDIDALGGTSEEVSRHVVRDIARSVPETYGIAYVVEGAQLGRASVRAAVERLGVAHACSYLDHREPNVWPRFLKALEESVTTPAAVEAACDAARHAFDRFRALAIDIRRGI